MIQKRSFPGAMLSLVTAPSLVGYQPTKLARSIAPSRYVSVLDFGADPTGYVDSSSAFHLAIKATYPGGAVYVPTGTYRTSQSKGI